jgi:hypothetical protein
MRVHRKCCGLDVRKKMIAACLLTEDAEGNSVVEKRLFGTMTRELHQLAQWLCAAAGHSSGDGGDRRLLDAGLECAGTLRAAIAAHQPGALQSLAERHEHQFDTARVITSGWPTIRPIANITV